MKKYKSNNNSKSKSKNKFNINKKGGKSFLKNIVGEVPGPFISDNIKQNVSLGKKEELLNEYEIIKENALNNYNRSKEDNIEYNNETDKKYDRTIKYINVIWIPILIQIKEFLTSLKDFVLLYFNKSLEYGGKSLSFIYIEVRNFSKGIIETLTEKKGTALTLIIFIIFMIILILLVFGFFNTNKNKRTDNLNQNDIFNFNNSIKQQNMFGMISEQALNLIPEEYRYQFNGFRNSLNKIFGNDIISNNIESINRETINKGRYDGIYHIKKDNENNRNHVESILQPKDVKFNININDYPNSDYFKLPKDLRENYFNTSSNIITIPPIYNNNSGKYIYKISNGYYGDDKDNKIKPELSPFEDIEINNMNYLKIRNIPLEKNIFSEKDNINTDIFKEKLLIYKDNKYIYPDEYIEKKIN